MEAVLRNLASTVELLAVAAQSAVVEQWDKQTLSRAFHWARYCEHIVSRFHNNPALRRIMEQQLQLTNESLRAAFPGHAEVFFSDLHRCQHLLLVGLLSNPELPSSIMKILFDTTPANSSQSDYQDVTGVCSHIVQCRAACEVLAPLTEPSAFGADAEVQGLMLLERLDALLSRGCEASQSKHFLDSVLQGFGGAAAEHFCLVIAAALLRTKDTQTASQEFLFDWLQKKHSRLQHMCSVLPNTLLIELVKRHQKFRDAYCDVLKKWASDMEYSLSDGEWIQTGTKQTVSFHKLSELFLALFEACPSLREEVEKELHALKMSNGDFDVRGLSVWGDLLSTFNK